MKIVSIETMKVPPSWVWVKVTTDEGLVGLGERYLECHGDAVIAEVERMKPFLLGEDPTAVEHMWQIMYNSGVAYVGGPIKMSAISGLDMAFWDIKGKALGQPIYKLLGGPTRTRIPFYHATGAGIPHHVEPGDPYWKSRPGDAPHKPPKDRDEMAQRAVDGAKELVSWGYRTLKFHVGMSYDFTRQDRIEEIVAMVAAVRKAVGDTIELGIDVHNPQPQMAVKLARRLEPYNMLFMEEPVSIERIQDLRIVAQGTTVPIAAGERWMGKWAFHQALDAGARVLQPDLAHAGGITELKKIAAMAECYGAYMAPHCPLSALAIVASMQLGGGIPNYLVQEHNEVNDSLVDGKTVIGAGYFKKPLVLEDDGCIALPEGPGLGIELDEAGMEAIMAKPWTVRRG